MERNTNPLGEGEFKVSLEAFDKPAEKLSQLEGRLYEVEREKTELYKDLLAWSGLEAQSDPVMEQRESILSYVQAIFRLLTLVSEELQIRKKR